MDLVVSGVLHSISLKKPSSLDHIEGKSSPSGCPYLLVSMVQPKKRLGDQAGHLPTGNQHPGLGELNWSHRTSMLSVEVSSHTDLHLPFPGLAWPLQILTRPKLIWTYLYAREQSSGHKPGSTLCFPKFQKVNMLTRTNRPKGLARDPRTQLLCGESVLTSL